MNHMNYTVRNAVSEDLPRIEEIYAYARSFMEKTGNPNQWGKTNPPHEWLVDDIEKKLLYVITDDQGIHGVFYFFIGPDPTYSVIENGYWRSNTPYGTIHRIAGDGSGGVLAAAVAFGKQRVNHLRIDTHDDNKVMQRTLVKLGFEKRGIIYVREDNDPRIAFEKL